MSDPIIYIPSIYVAGSTAIEKTFEYINKNLKSYPYVFNYSGDILISVVFTVGLSTITKTFNYTLGKLTSIVLSGALPSGIQTTKTFNYTGETLTSVSYL